MSTNTQTKLLTGALLVFAAVVLIFLSQFAKGATGTFIAADGSVTCALGGVQVTQEGNATLTVVGCEAFSCDTGFPPEPPPPPPVVTGDPGSGVWRPNSATTIFDLTKNNNRTFVPGCIDGQDWHSGCPHNGGMVYGQAYGARVKLSANSAQTIKVERAETGEDSASVRGALSAVPGALTATDPRCSFNPINQSLEVQDAVYAGDYAAAFAVFGLQSTACVVPSNTALYFNFTPDDARCGNGFECRAQIITR